jgi:RING-like zinc finger
VNELYVSALRREASGSGSKPDQAEEKRKARVKGLLQQLPIDSYVEGSGKGGDVECAICMIDFVPGEPIRYLPCMHCYHVDCIGDWLLRSFTCPSCMEPVDSAILSSFNINATADLSSLACTPAQSHDTSGASATDDSSSPAKK